MTKPDDSILAHENRPITYSFIIPARNEEKDIARCIQSINATSTIHDYEIIVVDNGSTDKTALIAENAGSIVLHKEKCFVGAVRNVGAKNASGKILCFVDADCTISPGWFYQVEAYANELKAHAVGVVGAEHLLPPESNLLQRSWFSHQRRNFVGAAQMIPTGNMIISTSLFEAAGGFNEELTSGEDFEFCDRLRNLGFSIIHDCRLECFHYGNPNSLDQFFKRERWHGRGMVADLKDPLRSRPLLISIAYVVTYIAGIFILLISLINVRALDFAPFLLVPVILPPALFSFWRSFKSSRVQYFPVLCLLYFVYSVARSISLMEICLNLAKRTFVILSNKA